MFPSVRPLYLVLSALLAGCQPTVELPNALRGSQSDEVGEDLGRWMSMDLAPDGERLAVAMYDATNGGLVFAVGTPDDAGEVAWMYEQVDGFFDDASGLDSGDRGQHATMKVDPDGGVWIAYLDGGRGNLRWAYRGTGPKTWITGELEGGSSSAPTGQWADMQLDADGRPVIAYHHAGEGTLHIARFDAFGTDDDGATTVEWTIEEAWRGQPWTGIDASGSPISREASVGTFARVHLAATGAEQVFFYDAAQQRLSMIEGGTGNWRQFFLTDEGVDMGQWPSVRVDEDGTHIAYHDVQNQHLMYAFAAPGGTYLSEVVDQGEYTGADTEIVKMGGQIAVLYFDGQYNNLKLANKQGAEWVKVTLAGEETAVGFHNEIVRIGDDWWVGSYDYTLRQPHFQRLQPTP